MNDSQLRDRLLELETVTPELEARYRARMAALLEMPLTTASRVGVIVGLVMGVGFFVLFSTLAITTAVGGGPDFPVIRALGFALGGLFGLAWAILSAVILKKGTFDRRIWGNLTQQMTWVFCVLLAIALQVLGSQMEDPAKGTQMILGGILVMAIFGIPALITGAANQSELIVRKRFLQLELDLAEMKDFIVTQKIPGAAPSQNNSD